MILPGLPTPVIPKSQVVQMIYTFTDNSPNGTLPMGLKNGDVAVAHAFGVGGTLYSTGDWPRVGTLVTGTNRNYASYRKSLGVSDSGTSYTLMSTQYADYHAVAIFRPKSGFTIGAATGLVEALGMNDDDMPYSFLIPAQGGPSIVSYSSIKMDPVQSQSPAPDFTAPINNDFEAHFYQFPKDTPAVSGTYTQETGYSSFRGFRLNIT